MGCGCLPASSCTAWPRARARSIAKGQGRVIGSWSATVASRSGAARDTGQAMSQVVDDRVEAQRTMVERVGVRWPRMARGAMRWVMRLPPGSRARRSMLEQLARIAFLLWNRGDFALVPVLDDPEVETHITTGARMAVGLDDLYYGPEGHCRAMEVWNEAWKMWDAEIDEIIEEGRHQVLIVARVFGEGAASGIKLEEWERGPVHVPRGPDLARGWRLGFRQSQGPRSRRDLGVGDVAGEPRRPSSGQPCRQPAGPRGVPGRWTKRSKRCRVSSPSRGRTLALVALQRRCGCRFSW